MSFVCLIVSLNFLIVKTALITKVEIPEWTYDNEDNWCDISRQCCGNNQSPIALTQNNLNTIFIFMKPFYFINHKILSESFTIENDGRSVEFSIESCDQPILEGGGLTESYIFDNLHFHWGSEHTINGKRAALEMHIVYYSSKFANISSAMESINSDSIAVVAVLFDIDDSYINPALERITSYLKLVQFAGQSAEVKPFNILKLLPYKSGFYRYWGSLTTPPCSEVVVWTVMKEFLSVTSNQMRRFRSLIATPDDSSCVMPLTNNFRRTQPINGRRVYKGQQLKFVDFYKNQKT